MGSPIPAKSTVKAQTLLAAPRPRLAPLAAVPANPHVHRPQARLPSPDWMGREPGTSCYQSGSPLLSHTRAQVRPRTLLSPPPLPHPRALAEAYRPGRCPSTGPASRASGPAPTWRRRSGRTSGGGAQAGPLRAGWVREGGSALLSRWPPPPPPPPRGLRKGSRRGRGSVRAALLTTTRTWRTAAPKATLAPSLRPVPGTEATRATQALASNTATRQKPSAPPKL